MKDDTYEKFVKIMNKIKPFIALFILLFIALSLIQLYRYNNLQQGIKATCGYKASESVYCVCDKSFVSRTFAPTNPYYNSSVNLNFSVDGNSNAS